MPPLSGVTTYQVGAQLEYYSFYSVIVKSNPRALAGARPNLLWTGAAHFPPRGGGGDQQARRCKTEHDPTPTRWFLFGTGKSGKMKKNGSGNFGGGTRSRIEPEYPT